MGKDGSHERSRIMRQIADAIARNVDHLARIETRDNGKLIREMSGQVKYLVNYYHYFAGAADKIQGEVIPSISPPCSTTLCASPWAWWGPSCPGTRPCF